MILMFVLKLAVVFGGFLLAHCITTWSLVEDTTAISGVNMAVAHNLPVILASRKNQHGY